MVLRLAAPVCSIVIGCHTFETVSRAPNASPPNTSAPNGLVAGLPIHVYGFSTICGPVLTVVAVDWRQNQ